MPSSTKTCSLPSRPAPAALPLARRPIGHRGCASLARQNDSDSKCQPRVSVLDDSMVVPASAEQASQQITDASRWTDIFPPCKGARIIEQKGNDLTIEVTATVGDEVRTKGSRWTVHPAAYRPPRTPSPSSGRCAPCSRKRRRVRAARRTGVSSSAPQTRSPSASVQDVRAQHCSWTQQPCQRHRSSSACVIGNY